MGFLAPMELLVQMEEMRQLFLNSVEIKMPEISTKHTKLEILDGMQTLDETKHLENIT